MTRKSKRRWSWRRQVHLWRSALTLAAWRWRTQWFLLLITALGISLAVLLVSSLPLFNDVMSTAGLRAVLRNQPGNTQILATAKLEGIDSSLIANAIAQIDTLDKQEAGHYLAGTPQTTLITGNWHVENAIGSEVDFYGVPIQGAASHLQLLQGQLPSANQPGTTDLGVALTPSAASFLHVKVGSRLSLVGLLASKEYFPTTFYQNIEIHVTGIFQVQNNDPYWNGYTLYQPPPISNAPTPPVLALVDQASLYHMLDAINQQQNGEGVYFSDRSQNELFLSYTLNAAQITSNDVADMVTRLGTLQLDISQQFGAAYGENVTTVDLNGALVHNTYVPADQGASLLEKFQNQMQVTGPPILFLAAEIFCLMLFFISTMVGALVERDRISIAVLRSRGANRRQVFGALLTQGLALCLLAGLAGPLLALLLVRLVAPHLLTPTTSDALNALTIDAGAVVHSLALYTSISVAVIFLTLLLTLFLAVRTSILAQWRETARETRPPLWQRLRLDLVVMALAILGYGAVWYLEQTQQLLSVQGQSLVATPLALLAPLLLLLAGILAFTRLFPWLLKQLVRLAQRRRDLASMLALAQMARAPRQATRMTLLLGLATAFTLFALIFSASQSQRGQDLASYQAISDFSGYNLSLPTTSASNVRQVLQQVDAAYQHLQGVTAVSVGYIGSVDITLGTSSTQPYSETTDLLAVDADTYAQTVRWTNQYASQSLASLMALLVKQRPQALQEGVVPAIVAASTWQTLGLTPGMAFHLTDNEGDTSPVTYIATAKVNHIPPFDDATDGVVLVDYQTLDTQVVKLNPDAVSMQPNYVWLNTKNNSNDVNAVRNALTTSPLALSELVDRRQISSGNARDPLVVNLLTILSLGVAAALLVAFLANLLLPLLSLRTRQTSFAVLRALGTAPKQVTTMLVWELATILSVSLLLGLLFGALLAFTSVPPLVFTGVLPTSLVSTSTSTIYALQHLIPVTIVLPTVLPLALLLLLMLCLLALAVIARLAQRPLMGQALRLEEN